MNYDVYDGNKASVQKTAKQKVWRVVRWAGILFLIFYTFGLALNAWHWFKTPAAVERIHARAVTFDMLSGAALPPAPRADERDMTVVGVDVNKNGVRDDVEIEIHRRHADSAKIRAAQLQYAMALQSQLTDVFSEGTLVAAVQESDRADNCIDSTHKTDFSFIRGKDISSLTQEELDSGNKLSKEHEVIVEPLIKEVEDLVLNTEARKFAYEQTYDYMTSYGGSPKPSQCDIALDTLPN